MAPLGVFLIGVLAAVALVALVLLYARRRRVASAARARAAGPRWKPTVQHVEIPAPSDDPAIRWQPPEVDAIRPGEPPLRNEPLSMPLRAALDGYALGRVKRILEAPDLLHHAAADPETWPGVEATVQQALALAQARGVTFNAPGREAMMRALALCAAQGTLLAEWRQLEDGPTVWEGAAARIRASDAFAIQRLVEAMQRRVLPDLFGGIDRRSATFDVTVLVAYCVGQAFARRLHGQPPRAFAA
ncbi:MAG TPA: hypothetical protein VET65_00430 [Candidatus Limnocylindrales bacterium]|nr:hypothetical protein [Candidatus Limnocylindrales bacterium]